MKQWTAPATATALALVVGAPAQADVSAMQVWESWRAQAEALGQTITAQTEVDGDTLRLTDVVTTFDGPDGTLTGTLESLEFQERADGTVAITLAPTYAFRMDMQDGAETAQVDISVTHQGLAIIASGDADAISYSYLADTITATVDSLVVDGVQQDATIAFTVSDMTGDYSVTGSDAPEIAGTITAGAIGVVIAGTDAEDGTVVDIRLDYAGVEATTDSMLTMMDSNDMAAMLAAGFSIGAEMLHGPASVAVAVQDGDEMFNLSMEMEGGSFYTALGADGMAYDIGAVGLDAAVSGSEIPFPELTASVDELGFGFDMPVQASDTPSEFSADLTLAGLTVADMLWMIVDPGQNLPRDPATLIVELSGQANWLFDIMDPELQENPPAGPPGELHALSLDNLTLSLVGAQLTGTGAFTFDNTDLETFEGLPAPTGGIDLQLVGGQGLLDKLVGMGLVPEDQAMAARMMLGLFARPGDGPDTLTSKIEVRGDGAILANGQRLQ